MVDVWLLRQDWGHLLLAHGTTTSQNGSFLDFDHSALFPFSDNQLAWVDDARSMIGPGWRCTYCATALNSLDGYYGSQYVACEENPFY
jgi:hypothetical protein